MSVERVSTAPLPVAGVDGTRGGWVAVVLTPDRVISLELLPLQTDFSPLRDVAVIGIDVPVGFGPRQADRLARRYLRGAASTVFSVPSRAVLEQPFGPGLGVSAQSHALAPRILHVTELARTDGRLHEVHPEASFRTMNGDVPLRSRKKTADGALQRLELLEGNGIRISGDLGDCRHVPLDDVLDAAAAAWTAARIRDGSARSFPDPPDHVDGLPTAIWC